MSEKALLALEDGTYFFGKSLGIKGETFGELVFNTSVTGYQEVLTDPSYTGQIVVMTYPEIGIYGVNEEDIESNGIKVAGFVVYRSVEGIFNYRGTMSFQRYLFENNIVAIENIDTRTLTKKIRTYGTLKAAISTLDLEPRSLISRVRKSKNISEMNLVEVVSPSTISSIKANHAKYNVVVIDSGIKYGILRELSNVGANIIRVPYNIDVESIKSLSPDGILISNGPGDPSVLKNSIETIAKIIKLQIPLAGICLGHQLIALAIGGKTYKMKFGHRGINHPVKDLRNSRISITTHNHGFAVEPESLEIPRLSDESQSADILTENLKKIEKLSGKSPQGFGEVEVTHISLNDGTIEGLRLKDYPVLSVQFHPEASPGPHDARDFFKEFVQLIEVMS
ncbi:MAG: carbamoyl-phosphate synthase small subunit [Thermotogaceae bacterium]|jgi:carbamoyl-phosphate synthase small subunit|nr:carbamoyl-phosphate synthase small subunit [Thermotogaceae bacterium]MDN5337886.1 carbamoyl-phosphate synthase small subunit [Thermotogaceae bacterium]